MSVKRQLFELKSESQRIAWARITITPRGDCVAFECKLTAQDRLGRDESWFIHGPDGKGDLYMAMYWNGVCSVTNLKINRQLRGLGVADWMLAEASQWIPSPGSRGVRLCGELSAADDIDDPAIRNQFWSRQLGLQITTKLGESKKFKEPWIFNFNPYRLKFQALLVETRNE